MQRSVDVLVKLFDRYKDVEIYTNRLNEQKKMLSTFREARKYQFIPDMVDGKKQFKENLIQINNLQVELDNLVYEQAESKNEADIEKSRIKSQLQNILLRLETELQSKKRRMELLDMIFEYGLYPTSTDLSALQDFFPNVNLRKIYEVEKYHQKLACILDEQFSDEQEVLQKEIAYMDNRVQEVRMKIDELGFVGTLSKDFLDKHSEIKGRINALKAQNDAFLMLKDLQDNKKKADDVLKRAIEDILINIENSINSKMKEYNNLLFTEQRKAPYLRFKEYNSYIFETPDDTGTGSNYKGMVVYDLAILALTAIPAIAHDSLILKNIGDGAVDGIMKIYAESKKQVFIAFDKQTAYMPDTQKIIANNTVLKLSDGNCELYGESWNKEVAK